MVDNLFKKTLEKYQRPVFNDPFESNNTYRIPAEETVKYFFDIISRKKFIQQCYQKMRSMLEYKYEEMKKILDRYNRARKRLLKNAPIIISLKQFQQYLERNIYLLARFKNFPFDYNTPPSKEILKNIELKKVNSITEVLLIFKGKRYKWKK